jgi:DNA-binding NarL/FixJ family response regulator
VPLDPLLILETLYRLDLTGESWLGAVMAALQPFIDRDHLGIFGAFYEWSAPHFMSPGTVLTRDVGDRLRECFAEASLTMPRSYVAAVMCSPAALIRSSDMPSWRAMPVVRGGLRAAGAQDLLSIKVREADGTGCWLGSFHADNSPLAAAPQALLAGVTRHLTAAYRIQRSLGASEAPQRIEAVLDANCRVCHAETYAQSAPHRDLLERAAKKLQRLRTRAHRQDVQALSEWDVLVAGRWTLVDHFERNGQKYILAVENAGEQAGLGLLTERERDVVQRAAKGIENKAIADELGISHSTVRVLMARAVCKLGLKTRAELVEKFEGMQEREGPALEERRRREEREQDVAPGVSLAATRPRRGGYTP